MKATLKSLMAALLGASLSLAPLSSKAQDFSVSPRVSYLPRYYSLDLKEAKTVPVHPDDAGFLHGATDVKAGNGLDFLAFDLGLQASSTWQNGFMVYLGADAEFDFMDGGTYYPNGKRKDSGMFSSRQQVSDTRPASSGSFVYDQLNPETFSILPFIGVGMDIMDSIHTDIEWFFPFRKFKREWGHHRYDSEEPIGTEEYNAKGSRIALKIGHKDSDVFGGIELMHEDYKLENSSGDNAGKLSSNGIGLFYSWKF